MVDDNRLIRHEIKSTVLATAGRRAPGPVARACGSTIKLLRHDARFPALARSLLLTVLAAEAYVMSFPLSRVSPFGREALAWHHDARSNASHRYRLVCRPLQIAHEKPNRRICRRLPGVAGGGP